MNGERRGKVGVRKSQWDKNLDPCPFCGSKELKVVEGVGVGLKQPMAVCVNCGLTASFYEADTYIKLMEQWNERSKTYD